MDAPEDAASSPPPRPGGSAPRPLEEAWPRGHRPHLSSPSPGGVTPAPESEASVVQFRLHVIRPLPPFLASSLLTKKPDSESLLCPLQCYELVSKPLLTVPVPRAPSGDRAEPTHPLGLLPMFSTSQETRPVTQQVEGVPAVRLH